MSAFIKKNYNFFSHSKNRAICESIYKLRNNFFFHTIALMLKICYYSYDTIFKYFFFLFLNLFKSKYYIHQFDLSISRGHNASIYINDILRTRSVLAFISLPLGSSRELSRNYLLHTLIRCLRCDSGILCKHCVFPHLRHVLHERIYDPRGLAFSISCRPIIQHLLRHCDTTSCL